MKKILFLTLFLLSGSLKAENYVQFRSGNYAFAENGKLTFNIEPSLYENRTWKYNEASKDFFTQFKTNKITLKTKHASKWHFYDSTYVSYQNQNNQYFVRPIYNPYQNQFHNQKTFWPAVGWVVRVGGRIAAEVAPPIIRKCLTNAKCAIGVGVAAPHICIAGYVVSVVQTIKAYLPSSICARIEEDGYERDENGNYKNEVQYEVNYVSGYKSGSPVHAKKGFKNLDAALNFAKEKAKWLEEYPGRKCDEVTVKQTMPTSWTATCGFSSINVSKLSEVKEENLVFLDLENYVFEDMKANPTPYINSKSDLGKELRNEIKADKADVALSAIENGKNPDVILNPDNGSGLFTAVGEPYRDENGETKQDIVTISSPVPSSKAEFSGSLGQGSSGATGTSSTKNNVSVISKSRPDKEGDAGVGENNNKDGTSSSNPNSSGSGNSGTSEEGEEGETAKNICETNPDSIACMQAGGLENESGNPFTDALKTTEDGTKFGEQNILPSSGLCPAPKQFTVMGKIYEIRYYWICEFALKIRGLIIALAALAAGYIVFGIRKD